MSPLLLALAVALGLGLRLLGALLRPVWVDEAASAIFSAGNSSWLTPINTVVPLEPFIAALRLTAPDQVAAALGHLRLEDNHPPLHFGLAFAAAQLLQRAPAVMDPLTARLPAVLAGSLAVPLLALAVRTASGNRRAALLAGLLMAVSPLGVALGLEARHYALATTLVCGALWALAAAWQGHGKGQRPGVRLISCWLLVNALGMLSHHLFLLCIAAQLLSLVVLSWRSAGHLVQAWRILLIPSLSLLLALAWLQLYGAGGAADQTAWLLLDRRAPGQWLVMPLQLLVTGLSGLLAPGTALSHLWQWPLLIAAGLATLLGLAALVRLVRLAAAPEPLLLVFSLSSGAVLLGASVLSGKDFSRALRYGFVLLPGLLALVAVAAAQVQARGRGLWVQVLLGCSLICSLGVASGVALPASYNPELYLKDVAQRSQGPIVLVFNDRVISGGTPLIGYEGLSVAWQQHSRKPQNLRRAGVEPRWMLLSGSASNRTKGLEAIAALEGPFDLWVVNAHGTRSPVIPRQDCKHLHYNSAGGHLHDHYRCGDESPS